MPFSTRLEGNLSMVMVSLGELWVELTTTMSAAYQDSHRIDLYDKPKRLFGLIISCWNSGGCQTQGER